jgi:hypothetical protein
MSETGHKDINELVKAGWSIENILRSIEENIAVGLEAKVRFNQWKKI